MSTATNTIDAQEVANFTKDAAQWWDIDGPFAPLHKLNPTRIWHIKQQILQHYNCESLKGLSILDIGCGGGLVCEPLARLGADVTGADADAKAIEVANAHGAGLGITYLNEAIENLPMPSLHGSSGQSIDHPDKPGDHGGGYDVVLALEIIEHVASPDAFVAEVARLVKPGGIVIFSTLNRTAKSFALGIVAAEYILRWVPAGTHNWKKFIKPSELAGMARHAGLSPNDVTGLHYNPLTDEFSLSTSALKVNYFLSATKPKE